AGGVVQARRDLMDEAKGLRAALHAEGEVFVRGVWVRLRHPLHNVVDNGGKYAPAGGTVRLTVERAGQRATISVADTGIGIPAEALPHIFARFYRVDTARSLDGAGGGLGLSICQWVARAHGGGNNARGPNPRGRH